MERHGVLSEGVADVGCHPLDGLSLGLTCFESEWESGRLLLDARGPGISWTGSVDLPELEAALGQAVDGIDSDVSVAGEAVPVRVVEDAIEIRVGPFLVVGTPTEWRDALDRERAAARPLSTFPHLPQAPTWSGELIRFPVTSTD